MDRKRQNLKPDQGKSEAHLSLLDMVPLEDLQQIQDTLAEINGVASVITDTDGNPLTMPSRELAICEMVHRSERGTADCMTEFRDILSKINRKQQPVTVLCEQLGIFKAAVPIIINEIHLGSWWVSQCSKAERPREELAAYADRIGVEPEKLLAEFDRLPQVDEAGFQKILEGIDSLIRRITRMGYQNLLLSRNLSKLHHLESELTRHQSQLEDLVQRRTADLMTTNNRLQLEAMERDLADEQVERKYKLLSSVNQILQQTLLDQSEQQLALTFLKAAKNITGSPLGFIVKHEEQGWKVAAIEQSKSDDDAPTEPLDEDLSHFEIGGIWKQMLDSGDPIAVSSINEDHLIQPLPKGYPKIKSLLAVPLRRELRTSGFIALANNRQGYELMDQNDVQDLSKAFIEALKRRQSHRTQSANEARFTLALESANEGLWDYTPREGHIFFSSRWFMMLGYSMEEFPQTIETWHTLAHPDDLPVLEGSMKLLSAGDEENFNIEIRMLSQLGQWRWIQVRGQNVSRDADGNVTRIVGTLIDISKYKQVEVALQKANDELLRLAALDDLTQIANRRRFDDRLAQEWRRAQRDENSLAVIICDIDFFKDYNDTYGHLRGDDSLYKVAQAIQTTLKRPMDLVSRYGGEEFAVILPGTDSEGAKRVAAQLKTAVDNLHIAHKSSKVSEYISLSFGVAAVVPAVEISSKKLIEAADKALYLAKENGRNRIEVSSDLATHTAETE